MDLVTIIIPIYKEIPDKYEIISLKQCYKVLKKYPITFVLPKGLNSKAYTKLANKKSQLYFKEFDKVFFKNIYGYNKLLLSKEFYESFTDYKYILIYQLDAFVFKDELEYWCNKGYDYIGAPWFEGFEKVNSKNISWVGNGGFSLRKTSAFLNIGRWNNFFKMRKNLENLKYDYLKNYKSFSIIKKILQALIVPFKLIGINNNTYYLKRNYDGNEDWFWCYYVPMYFRSFRISSIEDAIGFSFEGNPSFLYEKNNNKLPFGCHAWWRYDLEFWKEHIKKFGYQLK